MKRQKNWCILLAAVLLLSGCGMQTADRNHEKELEYEVMDTLYVPDQLKEQMEEKKKDPFLLVYGEGDWLYIAVGYGQKETEGYQGTVRRVYESDNTVFVETSLNGPSEEKENDAETVFPCIVIRIPYTEKRIISEM